MSGVRGIAGGLVLLLAGACFAPGARAIIGGATDAGDPAVALVVVNDSGICTGSLISARVLLTAASCLAGDSDPSHYVVLGGVDPLTSADWTAAATSVVVNPDYDPNTFAHDTGVLLLAAAPPAAPLPWLAADPGGVYQALFPFTAIGYGVTNAQSQTGSGIKRSVDLAIAPVDAATFLSDSTGGKGPCFGDTGGPALGLVSQIPTVLGLVSHGDQNCTQFAIYARTDADASFIASYAAEPGGLSGALAAGAALALATRWRAGSTRR